MPGGEPPANHLPRDSGASMANHAAVMPESARTAAATAGAVRRISVSDAAAALGATAAAGTVRGVGIGDTAGPLHATATARTI